MVAWSIESRRQGRSSSEVRPCSTEDSSREVGRSSRSKSTRCFYNWGSCATSPILRTSQAITVIQRSGWYYPHRSECREATSHIVISGALRLQFDRLVLRQPSQGEGDVICWCPRTSKYICSSRYCTPYSVRSTHRFIKVVGVIGVTGTEEGGSISLSICTVVKTVAKRVVLNSGTDTVTPTSEDLVSRSLLKSKWFWQLSERLVICITVRNIYASLYATGLRIVCVYILRTYIPTSPNVG